MTIESNPYQTPEASLGVEPRPLLMYTGGAVCSLVGLFFSFYTATFPFALVSAHREGRLVTMPSGQLALLGVMLVSVASCACVFLAAGFSFFKRRGRLGLWFLASGLTVVGLWCVAVGVVMLS